MHYQDVGLGLCIGRYLKPKTQTRVPNERDRDVPHDSIQNNNMTKASDKVATPQSTAASRPARNKPFTMT